MKRLLILLTLLCFVPPCESRAQCTEETPCPEVARLLPVMGKGVAAAPAGCAGTWYYAGDASTEPAYNQTRTPAAANYYYGAEFNWTSAHSGTAKYISVKLDDIGTSTECKVALYQYTGSGLDTLLQSGVISSPVVGWNDVAITDTSISNLNYYAVTAICDGGTSWRIKYIDTVGIKGTLGAATSYAAFPEDPSPTEYVEDAQGYATRICLE